MATNENISIPWPGWRLIRRLGGGGFGDVYEIEREFYGDKERAAMKVIQIPKNPFDLDEDYASGMTEEEIRNKYSYIWNYMIREYEQMLALKGHSNIVNCHDFSVVENPHRPGGAIYIRMELLTPLQKALEKETFSESKIIQVGTDICQALVICQEKNIIHRDIKPDNIMISEFGSFKLGDFGLARTMEKTMSATTAGTDWYMAPEVAKKMKYGKSVDTYSLGLVLYWLLNHYRLPFVPAKDRITAKDMDQAYRLRVQGKEIPEPAQGSPRLKQIVLKALSYQSEQRYHSAKDMLDALQSIGNSSETGREPVQKEPVRKEYAKTTASSNVLGIYLGREEIHVRMWIAGETRPILTMMAVYTSNDLGDILTGIRAVNYQKIHKEKNLYSVLDLLRGTKADEYDGGITSKNIIADKECAEKSICLLMKELKKALAKTPYGNIQECVLTAPVSSPTIQKSIYRATMNAGFSVIRQITTGVSCAYAKAYSLNQNQNFIVCTMAKGEQQYVTAEYTSDILEITDIQTNPQECEKNKILQNPVIYYACDRSSLRRYGDTISESEELSILAADGAALEGAKLSVPEFSQNSILLLDLLPWKVGLEIADIYGKIYFPLKWLIAEHTTLPFISKPVQISLDSGIRDKTLRLYIGNDNSLSPEKKIMEWNLEERCGDFRTESTQLEASINVYLDSLSIETVLRETGASKKEHTLSYLQYETLKEALVSPSSSFVPEQLLLNIREAAIQFHTNIQKNQNLNPSIEKGMKMINTQSATLWSCQVEKHRISADTFIEKLLELADNLEYGLKEASRMHCHSEKRILQHFYQEIRHILSQMGLIPVEAEGLPFDPHFHHAVMTDNIEGVEKYMITEEVQKGYLRGEKLVRPARVKVNK